MARGGRRGTRKRKNVRRRRAPLALSLALLLAAGLFGWMYVRACIVRVRAAEVYLPDLPAAFDGVRLLYVSDLNIRGDGDAAAVEALMGRLADLSPDLLLLGGDYSAANLLDALNGASGDGAAGAQRFLRTLVGFPAPLGKFAVLGEADDPTLESAFAAGGVRLLRDAGARVERGGAQLTVVGLRDAREDATPYDQIARGFSADECVLVLAHNPSAYTRVRMAEARGGGPWADLVLSGHTLGGQIKLFGRTLRPFSDEESRRIAGWYYGDDLPALVSQGVGCKGAKLRLGTSSEVWLITLRRPIWQGVEN